MSNFYFVFLTSFTIKLLFETKEKMFINFFYIISQRRWQKFPFHFNLEFDSKNADSNSFGVNVTWSIKINARWRKKLEWEQNLTFRLSSLEEHFVCQIAIKRVFLMRCNWTESSTSIPFLYLSLHILCIVLLISPWLFVT